MRRRAQVRKLSWIVAPVAAFAAAMAMQSAGCANTASDCAALGLPAGCHARRGRGQAAWATDAGSDAGDAGDAGTGGSGGATTASTGGASTGGAGRYEHRRQRRGLRRWPR